MKLIDLHCDTLTGIKIKEQNLRENDMHLDLIRMQQSDWLAQCFAIFINQEECLEKGISPYDFYKVHKELFYEEMKKNSDLIAPAFYTEDILANKEKGLMSGILTIEGGEAFEGKCERAEEFRNDGVRMITLTWNYENELGFSNLTGGHLKPKGREIVDAMNRLGILVDVSHLSDEGFWDCVELAGNKYPVVASHSDARALCNHTRNMTDEMLKALGETEGVVGINFCSAFLIPESMDTTLEAVLNHTLHLIDKAGIDHVAFGSDYDGIISNLEWKDASGTEKLLEYLHKKISYEDLEKITHKNALRVFEKR